MRDRIIKLINQLTELGYSTDDIYKLLHLPSKYGVTRFRKNKEIDLDLKLCGEYLEQNNIQTVFDVDAKNREYGRTLRYDLDNAIIDLLLRGWTVGNVASLLGLYTGDFYKELYKKYTVKSEREQSDWYYLLTFGDKEPSDLMSLETTQQSTPSEEVIAKIHAKWSPYR